MIKDASGNLLDDVNDQVSKLWADWSKRPEVTWEHDFAKVERLAARAWFRDGETFAQLLSGNVPSLDHGTAVPFSIEQLEADYCPVGLNEASQGIRQGVKKNTWGRPNTYYFYKSYPTEGPGEVVVNPTQANQFGVTLKDVKGVIAPNVVHLKHVDRVRQTRGVSIFSSVFTRLDDLKDYEESERVAARIGAAFAFAITKTIDAAPSTTSTNFREMDIAPGIIADTLAPGEKVESLKNERPDNKITDFRANQLKAIAGGTASGYSSIAKSYDGSYSSQRQELVEQGRITKVLRGEFVAAFRQPIYEAFINAAWVAGLIDLRAADPLTIHDAEHVGLGTPYIEPKREADAQVVAVQAGFKSKTQVILENGDNPREVSRQIETERTADNEKGLVFSSDSGSAVNSVPDSGSDPTGSSNEVDAEDEPGDEPDDEADDDETERAIEYVEGRTYEGPGGKLYRYVRGEMVLVDAA
jgi:lambda family phage portal protein